MTRFLSNQIVARLHRAVKQGISDLGLRISDLTLNCEF
jgi:hypothetical protein